MPPSVRGHELDRPSNRNRANMSARNRGSIICRNEAMLNPLNKILITIIGLNTTAGPIFWLKSHFTPFYCRNTWFSGTCRGKQGCVTVYKRSTASLLLNASHVGWFCCIYAFMRRQSRTLSEQRAAAESEPIPAFYCWTPSGRNPTLGSKGQTTTFPSAGEGSSEEQKWNFLPEEHEVILNKASEWPSLQKQEETEKLWRFWCFLQPMFVIFKTKLNIQAKM